MTTAKIMVLLVEDERRDARLIQAMLGAVTGVAFEVEPADRLSAALQRLAQGGIDVVLLDLSLPDSRGLDTFVKVQRQNPSVPIVVMTGLDDEAVATEAVKRGAQDYLIKGQTDQGLLSRSLRYAIERKESERVLRSRLELEGVISEMSSRFIGAYDLDDAINACLKDLGVRLSATRVYIFLLASGGGTISKTHEWRADGVPPKKDGTKALPSDDLRWLMAGLAEETHVVIENVANMPREAKAERLLLQSHGSTSALFLPLNVRGELAGFIGVDSAAGGVDWSESDLVLPRMAAQIISTALDREEAEEASIRSEQRFRAVLDRISDGVAVMNADRSLRYFNVAGLEMVGLTWEDVEGKAPSDVDRGFFRNVHPDDVLKLWQSYEKAAQNPGVGVPVECRFLREDGSWHYVETVGVNLLNDPAVNGMVLVARDITDRVKAEEALGLREQFYRRLIEKAPNSTLIVDAQGVVLYISPTFERLLGHDAAQGLGENAFNYMHPEDAARVAGPFAELVATPGASAQVEVRVMHADGAWGWVEVVGTNHLQDPAVHGIVLNFRDMTEHVQADQALRESEEKYRNVVERATEGIAILQDGIIKYSNPALALICGYQLNEGVGKPMLNYLHPDEISRVMDRYKRRMAGEELSPTYESALVGKDGRRIEVELTAGLVTCEGKPADMVMFRDITERKKTEEALRKSEEKLKDLVEKLRLSQEALSTPVVQIWENVLALPLIGLVDDRRAQHVMEVLLKTIVATQSELVILDVTGVTAMDSQVASYVMQTVRSAWLLGAHCVLTGIQPEVAQTVIGLELDMAKVVIKKDMREGLKWALHSMGYQVKNGQPLQV